MVICDIRNRKRELVDFVVDILCFTSSLNPSLISLSGDWGPFTICIWRVSANLGYKKRTTNSDKIIKHSSV